MRKEISRLFKKGRRVFVIALVPLGLISGLAFGRGAVTEKPAITLGVALMVAPSSPRAQDRMADPFKSAQAVAQALVDAINAHDLDAVLRTYAPDSVARRLPGGEEFLHGHADIRAKFVAMFAKDPAIRVEVVQRVVHGDFVFDREKITGRSPGGSPLYGAVIYEIRDGLIRNEWYLPKTLTSE